MTRRYGGEATLALRCVFRLSVIEVEGNRSRAMPPTELTLGAAS